MIEQRRTPVDLGHPWMPRTPEAQPGNLVEKVTPGQATPVKDGLDLASARIDEDVAVDEVEMQHVPQLGACGHQRVEKLAALDERAFSVSRSSDLLPPTAHPAAGLVDERTAKPF